ncbi:hypothetical protein [Mesorhizobium amorphae]|nr:hypothetical protein [Mesorhizobium amorphae]
MTGIKQMPGGREAFAEVSLARSPRHRPSLMADDNRVVFGGAQP